MPEQFTFVVSCCSRDGWPNAGARCSPLSRQRRDAALFDRKGQETQAVASASVFGTMCRGLHGPATMAEASLEMPEPCSRRSAVTISRSPALNAPSSPSTSPRRRERSCSRVRILSSRAWRLLAAATFATFVASECPADPTQLHEGRPAGVFGEGSGVSAGTSSTGSLTYSFEFDLPEARGAAQPQLSLSYNSSASEGEAGYGWTLSLPTIERRPLSGWPRYIDTGQPFDEDRYVFAGQQLLHICTVDATASRCGLVTEPMPKWSGNWRYYRQQIEETYARFFLSPDRMTWRVQYKGGVVLELGKAFTAPTLTSGPAIEYGESGKPFRWRPVRLTDLDGNLVVYSWQALGDRGLLYLTDLHDTPAVGGSPKLETFAHHTQLDWEKPGFASVSYAKIDKAQPDLRLKRVGVASKTWSGSGPREVIRVYHLRYFAPRSAESYASESDAPLLQHSFLKEIQLEGKCKAVEVNGFVPDPTRCRQMPATSFSYQSGALTPTIGGYVSRVRDAPPGIGPDASNVFASVGSVAILDLNRDGLPDIVQSWPAGLDITVPFTSGDPVVDLAIRRQFAYLNGGQGSGLELQLRHQCLDMGSAFPGDLVDLNLGKKAGFLSETGDTTVLGLWGDSHMLWSGSGFGPVGAASVQADTAFCDAAASDPSHGAWRWNVGESGWMRAAATGSTGAANQWFVDVDGDGLPDSFNRRATPPAYSLENAWVNFTRQYQPNEPVPGQDFGPAVVPFVPDFKNPVDSIAPAEDGTGGIFFPQRHWYTDVNGDGLVDLLTHNSTYPANIAVVWPGDGRGKFGCDTSKQADCGTPLAGWPTWLAPAYTINIPASAQPITEHTFFHDVTGDGLADLIKYDQAKNGAIQLWINEDGKSLKCAASAFAVPCQISFFFDAQHGTFGISPFRLTIADMDANGIDDLVLIGKAGVWSSQALYSPPISSPRAPRPGLLTRISNGLGAVTLIDYETVQELDVKASNGSQPWEFHSAQTAAVVTKIRTQDVRTATPFQKMPEPYRIDRSVEYEYRDPAYDPWTRSLVGFRSIRERIGFDLAVTETTYWFGPCQRRVEDCKASSDDDPYKSMVGNPVRVERYIPQFSQRRPGKLLWSKIFFYTNDELLAATDGRTVRRSYAHYIDTYLYDTDKVTVPGDTIFSVKNGDGQREPAKQPQRVHLSEFIELDRSGNLIKSVNYGRPKVGGAPGPGIDGTITLSSEFQCNQDWQCLLSKESITSEPEVGPGRHNRYYYDARGRLVEGEAYLFGSLPLLRKHELAGAAFAKTPDEASTNGWKRQFALSYDSYGNVVRSIGAGKNGPCLAVVYDQAYAQFPRRTEVRPGGCTNSGIATETEYNRGFESLAAQVSASGARTLVLFDEFGRQTSVELPAPDGAPLATSQATTITYRDRSPLSWVTTTQHTGAGAPLVSMVVLNGLGERVLAFDKADPYAGDAGDWVMRGWTETDFSGRVDRMFKPTFLTGDAAAMVASTKEITPPPPVDSITTDYDLFGRVRSVTDGNVLAAYYSYEPLSVQMFDAEQWNGNGFSTTNEVDGHRRVARTIRTTANDEIRLDVAYLPTGEPLKITQSHMAGPDTVMRSFVYDSMGRIVSNHEPNTSVSGEPSWRYAWDDAGRLVGTSDARGCGKNIHYDGYGRILAEDYSPCLKSHTPYSSPNLATGDGTEAIFRYDTYEAGQVKPTPAFDDQASLAIGQLVSMRDRGAYTRISYDNRGRPRRVERRLASPGPPSDRISTRYTPHWYESKSDYDLGDRLIAQSTGVDVPALLVGNDSAVTYEYSGRGLLKRIGSSYGDILQDFRFRADGSPQAIRYGDAASTIVGFGYDSRRRLAKRTVARGAPSFWQVPTPTYSVPGPDTTQTLLEMTSYTYDDVGNPITIVDASPAADWPIGIKPASNTISYDDLYRVTKVEQVTGRDIQVSPLAAEELLPDRPAIPVRGAERLTFQAFTYDWKGNVTSTEDDQALRFDRSLGQIGNGETVGRPNQLRYAGPGITAHYDTAGNLIDLEVIRLNCSGQPAPPCTHRFMYEWDEVGQLSRARRWDYPAGPIPSGEPRFPYPPTRSSAWELRYAYSDGWRVLTAARGVQGETYTLDAFDTFRLERTNFTAPDYERSPDSVRANLADIAWLIHDGSLPSPSGNPNHIYLRTKDHLGSTSAVIDKETGELVERTNYQAFGSTESDYRPKRWRQARGHLKFTGKTDDIQVGTIYFGARFYSAHLGRWLSPDPLTIHAFSGDLNPYAYVRGRVARYADPVGLEERTAGGKDRQEHAGGYYTVVMPDGTIEIGEPVRQPTSFERGPRDSPAVDRMSVIPTPEVPDVTAGQSASSAGGVPTNPIQLAPGSRSDYLAQTHPALAPMIRGHEEEKAFIAASPIILGLLTSGIGSQLQAVQGFEALTADEIGASIDTIHAEYYYRGPVSATETGFAVEDMVPVSRWGRPSLEPGDWVMNGPPNYSNYVRSFKWDPNPTNIRAPYSAGEGYIVPPPHVVRPAGWGLDGWWKSLFGQRRYAPGGR